MEFIIFWILSIVAVAFVTFIIFQIDEKHSYGIFRGLLEDVWLLVILLIICPFINILACLVGIVIFLIILISEKLDDHNLNGDKILKKIFFIKDEE